MKLIYHQNESEEDTKKSLLNLTDDDEELDDVDKEIVDIGFIEDE